MEGGGGTTITVDGAGDATGGGGSTVDGEGVVTDDARGAVDGVGVVADGAGAAVDGGRYGVPIFTTSTREDFGTDAGVTIVICFWRVPSP
ncbi:MAG: hypothetical protein LBI40_03660, partial [Treponema sp.]|nr:hypothetical protein [Treponema sp.]